VIQPPTDNLYKFVAISGLLLFGFSQIYPLLQLDNLEKEVVSLTGEINTLAIEYDQQTPQNLDPQAKKELAVKREQARTKLELQKVALTRLKTLRWQALIGGMIAAVMIGVGFTLWYMKVQKYQDLILANQAGSSNSKAKDIPSVKAPTEIESNEKPD
jgi:hypothetical protein